VDHQEVTGIVKTEPWAHPVLVFAEDWPSLAFSAQAVGCLDITTWCHFKSGKSKVDFTSTRSGSSLSNASLEELAACYGNQHLVTVLIQGRAVFTNKYRTWAETSLTRAKTLELVPTCEVDGWDDTFLWKGDLSHQTSSGVTSGSWSYRCSEPLGDLRRGIDRNLGLLLKPTHGGRAISKIADELLAERRPLSESNLIGPGEVNPWVDSG